MDRTDEEIKEDIVDQLVWDSRVDASDVSVVVTNGVVRLDGTVTDYSSLETAREIARATRGVVLVENKISLNADDSKPPDKEIQAVVLRTLHELCRLSPERLSVSVEGGHATLKGNVPTLWVKDRAENLTSLISGVSGITNNLVVVPTEDIKDTVLAGAVKNAMERQLGASAGKVTVQVERGIVTLTGSVSNRHEHEAVKKAATAIRGVNGLEDQLKIES